MNDINWWAVVAATISEFVFGAIWYSLVFGKLWGRIHGFDKLSKAEQKYLSSKMGPVYVLQYLATFVSVWVLARFIALLPNYSPYAIGLMAWIGFVVTAQASSVLFGNDKQEWKLKKFLVQATGSLGYVLVAVFVLGLF